MATWNGSMTPDPPGGGRRWPGWRSGWDRRPGLARGAALVLAVLNFLLKPILVILTLPITLVTFGLFLFIINAIMVWFVGHLVSGFYLHSFLWALLFSLLLSLLTSMLYKETKDSDNA